MCDKSVLLAKWTTPLRTWSLITTRSFATSVSSLNFGRTVPPTARSFPTLHIQSVASSRPFALPSGLKGKFNVLTISFNKRQLLQEARTWYAAAASIQTEVQTVEAAKKTVERSRLLPLVEGEEEVEHEACSIYTVLLRPRRHRPFALYLLYRYRRLLRLYIANYLKEIALKMAKKADGSITRQKEVVELPWWKTSLDIETNAMLGFTKLDDFVEQVGLSDFQSAYVFVVKRDGSVLFCESGPIDETKHRSLRTALGIQEKVD